MAGSCQEKVEITTCADPTQRFLPGGTCADFNPPCGIVVGACCFEDGTPCLTEQQVDCTNAGGNWLGADTLCSQCPCAAVCPPGGTAEGEPVCTDDYVDVFNGGCTAAAPAFSPISAGETVCAQGGVFLTNNGLDAEPELDWYEVTVTSATRVSLTVEAEFPVSSFIFDGTAGCPGTELTSQNSFDDCNSSTISACVGPGVYWFVVLGNTFGDESACGAEYVATLAIPGVGPGDADSDCNTDLDDYAALADCISGPGQTPSPTPPRTIQDCMIAFDFD